MSDWKFASDASGWTLAKWIFATLGSAEDTPLDGGPFGGWHDVSSHHFWVLEPNLSTKRGTTREGA